jgi:hypothetical protein
MTLAPSYWLLAFATDSQTILSKTDSGCWLLPQITLFKNCPIKIICEISSNLKNLRDGLKAANVF